MRPRGFALILVLWVLVLLSIVAASFSAHVRVESHAAGWAREQLELQSVALAALHYALAASVSNDLEQRWQTNGQVRQFDFEGTRARIILRDEGSKIDLNYAPQAILLQLFKQQLPKADANALTGSLLDWRDRDDKVSPRGAESADYRLAGLSITPSNGPLTSIAELSRVMGFDSQMLDQLRPFITVHARRPRIDPQSAPLEVIQALPGISPAVAQRYVMQRERALANQQAIDYQLLEPASRFLLRSQVSALLSVDIEVSQGDTHYRELVVVRLEPERAQYAILSRQILLPAATTSDSNG